MNTEIAELLIDLTHRTKQDLHNLDSRYFMRKILDKGYKTLVLDGALIERVTDGIFLFVEEDVQFLIDDYIYLEQLLETNEKYRHGSFLNDGQFCFTATSDRKVVNIEFRLCPQLNVANLVAYTMNITEDEYIWWWRSIAHGIINLASLE